MTQTTLRLFEPVNGQVPFSRLLVLHLCCAYLPLFPLPPSVLSHLCLSFPTPSLPRSIYPPPSFLPHSPMSPSIYFALPILCSHSILPTSSLSLPNLPLSISPSRFAAFICLALFPFLPTVIAPLSHLFHSLHASLPILCSHWPHLLSSVWS